MFDEGRLGLLDAGEVVDLTDHLGLPPDAPGGGLLEALRRRLPLAELGEVPADAPRSPMADHRVRAPIGRPSKILGAPVNYRDHQVEMDEQVTIAELGLFLKAPSSVLDPGGTVRLPYHDKRTDQEGELAVVIARTARHVAAEDADEVVLGFTCALDITVRAGEDRSTRKSFDTFTPLGPVVVTLDELADPDDLGLRCEVGGQLRQDGRTRDLIYDVRTLVAYASSVMTLEPGDVILTGTPAGVGPIADGDDITVSIEGVGELTVSVSAADAIAYDIRPSRATVPATGGGGVQA